MKRPYTTPKIEIYKYPEPRHILVGSSHTYDTDDAEDVGGVSLESYSIWDNMK